MRPGGRGLVAGEATGATGHTTRVSPDRNTQCGALSLMNGVPLSRSDAPLPARCRRQYHDGSPDRRAGLSDPSSLAQVSNVRPAPTPRPIVLTLPATSRTTETLSPTPWQQARTDSDDGAEPPRQSGLTQELTGFGPFPGSVGRSVAGARSHALDVAL